MAVPKGVRYGGKPKGYKHKKTLEKEAALAVMRQMVIAQLEPMVKAQVANSIGVDHFFLRNEKTKQFERITDAGRIQEALNKGEEGSYYWIFTKDPSTQAFAALTDRTFGKPPERVELTGSEGQPLEIIIKKPWTEK